MLPYSPAPKALNWNAGTGSIPMPSKAQMLGRSLRSADGLSGGISSALRADSGALGWSGENLWFEHGVRIAD